MMSTLLTSTGATLGTRAYGNELCPWVLYFSMRLTPIGSINGSQPPGEGQSSTGDILGVPSPTGEGQWEGTAQECELLSFGSSESDDSLQL